MTSVRPGGRKYFRSWFTNMSVFFFPVKKSEQRCAPSMLAPTHPPATDGQYVSPSSRFLTLNWSSWSVCSETMGESSLGDPGPGDEATRDWSGQAQWGRLRGSESEGEAVCASHYLRLRSVFWRNQMGSIHTTLSSGDSLQPLLVIFCHQSSAIFSLPPLPLLLHLLLLLLSVRLSELPVCTVDFCSFTSDCCRMSNSLPCLAGCKNQTYGTWWGEVKAGCFWKRRRTQCPSSTSMSLSVGCQFTQS